VRAGRRLAVPRLGQLHRQALDAGNEGETRAQEVPPQHLALDLVPVELVAILTIAGGTEMVSLFDGLDKFGMLLLYGRMGGPPQGDIAAAVEKSPVRSLAYRYFSIHTLDDWPEMRARATNDLIRMLQEGTIKVPIYERIPLAEAPRAHRVFESGEVMGKLIMKP
jgi:NADPH:quinone reductase-like Zn-dependent oxidoreductase